MNFDQLWQILTVENVSAVGILLALVVLFPLSLHKEWLVTGPRWRAKVAECDELKKTVSTQVEENKRSADGYIEARIELAELRARIEERALINIPAPRRARKAGE